MNNSKKRIDINNIDIRDNISDFAGIIDPEYIGRIDKAIKNIENKTTIEIAIITIDSLEGRPIDELALQLFNKFGIGKKNDNNGILLLISKEDNQDRIEIGRGLEEVIGNIFLRDLQDVFVLPNFKNKKFGPGILKFVKIIADKLSEDVFKKSSIASFALGITGTILAPASFYAGIIFNWLYEWELPLSMRDLYTILLIGIPILAIGISAIIFGINGFRRFKIKPYYEKSRKFKYFRRISIAGIALGSAGIIYFLIFYLLFLNNYIF